MNWLTRIAIGMSVLAASGMFTSAMAAKTTAGSGYWTNGATWVGGVAPVDGDNAVIAAGHSVTVDVSVASLASLTNAGTLTFVGWLTVVTTTVAYVSGTITHLPQSVTATNSSGIWVPDNRIWIVCSNLVVATNGSINANAKGYLGGVGGARYGRGPGGGSQTMGGGGGYGGIGGIVGSVGGIYGGTYGSVSNPVDPGSGGGYQNSTAGNGGGVVFISATGKVMVNGTVSANGGGDASGNSGGSGGSIYIVCDTFDGTNGTLSARGGTGAYNSGGGGRIAVIYTNTAAQGAAPIPSVLFSAAPGGPIGIGDIGTLYFPDNRFLTETIIHSGQWMTTGFTNWAPNNLTISNGWIRFPAPGFSLAVTNNVTVIGRGASSNKLELTPGLMSCGGNIILTNGSLILYNGTTSNPSLTCGSNLTLTPGSLVLYSAATSGPTFNCGGDLTMTNGSVAASNTVFIYSGMTNGGGTNYSAQVNVTGDVRMNSNSWVYPWSHSVLGGAIRFSMRTLSVASSAGFNADAKGYAGGVAGTTATRQGSGPGGGSWNMAGGGGYGGVGGTVNVGNIAGGGTYGSATNPAVPGSGGGYQNGIAGSGGGVVWINATGKVTVNGTFTANGGGDAAGNSGGSGGSIYVVCDTFDGTNGTLSAKGGLGFFNSGGGGRIAVIYTNTTAQGAAPIPSVLFTTAPGGAKGIGDIGTFYFPDSRFLAEVIPHSGQWMSPGLTSWSPNNLTISNAWFRFTASDFSLTVSNAITVLGGSVPLNRFDLTPLLLRCGGDLVLTNMNGGTNGSYLYLLASTNSTPAADGCGPRVVVGGTLTLNGGAQLLPYCHPTNGCGIGFRMQYLTILSNGMINADGLGFRGGTSTTDNGKGPGGTLSVSATAGSGGAGYGGAGSNGYTASIGGVTYGSSNAPVAPGSGSGYAYGDTSPTHFGVAGGGLIRLDVSKSIILNGTISANGAAGLGAGGGSGGGIYVSCRTLGGSGLFRANGGTNISWGAGGGGGRIAVWRIYNEFTGAATVAKGGGAADGTVVWGWLPPPGTVLTIR